MKISFIIPAYNEEKWISRCIESITAQDDLPEFEVIVVDNGSTDGTSKVVNGCKHARAVYYTEARGPAAARNEGVRHAKGEFVVFFDADEIIPKDWTTKMLAIFEKRPELIAISGPYNYIEFTRLQKLWEAVFYWGFTNPISWLFERLKIGTVMIGGNLAVRRWAFEKIGGFEAKIKFYGDEANLSRRLIKIGPIKFYRNLWVYSSARRFMKEGLLKTQWLYTKNFFSELLFHKVATKEHSDVR